MHIENKTNVLLFRFRFFSDRMNQYVINIIRNVLATINRPSIG
jgi:hypothetical protein